MMKECGGIQRFQNMRLSGEMITSDFNNNSNLTKVGCMKPLM